MCVTLLGAVATPVGATQSRWIFYDRANGVDVFYSVVIRADEARVAWRCVNNTDEQRSCSVGAGRDKAYRCTNDGLPRGITSMPGERASVPPKGEYVFPSDWACRGLGANEVEPYGVRISIER